MTVRELELAGLPQTTDPPRGRWSALVERLIGPFRKVTPPPPRPPTGFYTDTTVCIGCKACEVACKQWNQLPVDGFEWTGNSYDNTGELSATSWRHVKFIEQFPLRPGREHSGDSSVSDASQKRSSVSDASQKRSSEHGAERTLLRSVANPSTPETVAAPTRKFALDIVPTAPEQGRWLMMSDVCKHCLTAPCQQACPTGSIIHNEFANVYIQPDICNGCSYCIAACPFGVITRSSFDGHSHKCTLCFDRQRDDLVPACAKACPTESIQFGPIEELRDRARKRVADLHKRGVSGAYLYGDTASETYSSLHSFYLLVDRPSVYGLPEKPFNPWLNMMGDYARALLSGLVTIAALLLVVFLVGQ